jgi:hypothetical protein
MAYTTVTRQSWFSRIGGAIKGVIIGLVLVVVAFPVLFLNEGRAVQRHKTLKEGAGMAVTISSDNVDSSYNGQLVHVTGFATTDEELSDRDFGVSVNAIHLKRDVEMYQWRENSKTETRTRTGGSQERTTTYTYDRSWSSSLINSDNFTEKDPSRVNPKTMPYQSREWSANNVTMGAFRLPSSMVNRIINYTRLDITSDVPVPEALAGQATIHDSGYYFGANPAAPEVGDLRVRFHTVYPTDVSIVAAQTGNTFETFTTPGTGGTISLLQVGTHTSDAMFQAAQAANRVLMWILRFVGFIMFLAGFTMIFAPLKVVADVLPIMGKVVGAGTGMIAFLLAGTLSFFVISIAWVFYRLLIGIPLLILAVAFAVIAIKKLKEAKAPPPPSEAPAQSA